MRMLISSNHFVLAVCILCLGVRCRGQADSTEAAPMEKAEQAALYSGIQGFVGNWWNGSDLYPDPCGWTPIQVWCTFLFLPSLVEFTVSFLDTQLRIAPFFLLFFFPSLCLR